jgi:hypothetical protein
MDYASLYPSLIVNALSLWPEWDVETHVDSSPLFPDARVLPSSKVRCLPVLTSMVSIGVAREYVAPRDVFEHVFSFLRGTVVINVTRGFPISRHDEYVSLQLYLKNELDLRVVAMLLSGDDALTSLFNQESFYQLGLWRVFCNVSMSMW